MATNPIQSTSRTFLTTLADINADPDLQDKPDWFKRVIAGAADVISLILNAQANNTYLPTAFTRQAVVDLAELIDYQLSGRSPATGIVLFYLNQAAVVFPKSLALADLVAISPGGSSISQRRFEARAAVVVSQFTETFTANPATDELTVARGYTTGELVQVSSSTTLPAGLAAATDYYVIRVSATLIQLATSLANARTGTQIDITDAGTGTHTIELFSAQITVFQQESKASVVVGASDAVTEWQEFGIPDLNVLADTVVVTIDAVEWTRISESFIDSLPTDKHYRVLYRTDGTAFVRFGNGTFGEVPGSFDINVVYAVGGGVDSNVATVGAIDTYGGTDGDVTAVSNPAAVTGGADAETLESAKRLAPLLLKARDRFVTAEDGEALSLDFDGLSLVEVITNAFGVLSARVVAIATGGGNPTGATQTSLQAFLIDRTVLESIDVRVENATITATAATSAAKMRSGFAFPDVLPFFTLAWQLLLTETGQEIKDRFDAEGISATVTLINSIFAASFASADFVQIQKLVEVMTPRQFGVDIQESDAFAFIDAFVDGIDFITIAVPTFPVVLAVDEITTVGSLTLTEIP